MTADRTLVNGRIVTVDPAGTILPLLNTGECHDLR